MVFFFYVDLYNVGDLGGARMTTGEKLAKLRKENNYTQEKLAELLGVSRQAISKWESDGAFPETEKLIQISKLYNCSIDYLIKNNNDQIIDNAKPVINEDEVYSFKKEANQSLKKYLCINLAPCLYTILGILVIMLLCFMPIARGVIEISSDSLFGENDFFFGGFNHGFDEIIQEQTVEFNFYDILFSSSYGIGNFIYLLIFIIQIVMLIIGVAIYLVNNKKLFIARNVLAFICSVLWILAMILIGDKCFGAYLMPVVGLLFALGMILINFNKFKPKEER